MEQATTLDRPIARQLPVATIGILLLTIIVTGAQFADPAVLSALRRNPTAFAAGEWWRLLTPLLVHADGWIALMFNSLGIVLVGPPAEHSFGSWRWLLLFLAGGLAGNIAGYAWDPYGAGSSVGMFGLIGGLLAWLLMRNQRVWPIALFYTLYIIATLIGTDIGIKNADIVIGVLACSILGVLLRRGNSTRTIARFVGISSILGALILILLSDNHGPPIMAGAGVAALMLWRDQRPVASDS